MISMNGTKKVTRIDVRVDKCKRMYVNLVIIY